MKKNIFLFLLAGIIFVMAPGIVLSADPLGSGLLQSSVGGLGLESELENSVANVIKTVLAVTGTVFLVLTIAGGIMWMTASGNEEKIGKAKKIIIGAIIGLAIILSAYTITSFVASRVGSETGKCKAPDVCISVDNSCGYGTGSGTCETGKHCCKTEQ
jgi:hypothetical protein